jgi:hypothetical protein
MVPPVMPKPHPVIAAVRIGALTLAISDVLGGNAFDAVIAGVADIAYRQESVYHALGTGSRFLTALAMALIEVGLWLYARWMARQEGEQRGWVCIDLPSPDTARGVSQQGSLSRSSTGKIHAVIHTVGVVAIAVVTIMVLVSCSPFLYL